MNKNPVNNFFHFLFVKEKKLNLFERIRKITGSFGHTEKIIFWFFSSVLVFSGLILLFRTNESFITEVPGFGGSLNEGVVGSARFVNPVLAVSDIDKSLVSLVYSGLLKPSNDGYAEDLAESYTLSENGLIYEIKIREDAYFHDGEPVTADDVLFTVEKATDPNIKSPRKSNWDGVTIEKVDRKTVRFILQKPYSPFLDNLTLGVLPQHVWKDAAAEEFPFSQWNMDPIGSGPFKVDKVKYNQSGIPVYISLKAYSKYTGGKPYISKINFSFFKESEEMLKAFENDDLDSVSGLSAEEARELERVGVPLVKTVMTRIFGVFLNQNHSPVLLNKEVRQALDTSLDKERIVQEVLLGYGLPLDGIAPIKDFKWNDSPELETDRITAAREILLKAGWEQNEAGIMQKKTKTETQYLSFAISTSNVPELKQTAEILKNIWTELGAQVEVLVFESSDLSKDVIKPRKYDALLFGEVIGREMDLYPFWHSSQRNDPGLNIALYTNIAADKILENIRTASSKEDKDAEINLLNNEIKKDLPTIFIYAPEYLYAVSPKIKNISGQPLGNGSDRFIGVEKWYIETDRVWNIFTQK